jgi:hypothetical protein
LYSLRKSIYIPVGFEKKNPLEFDEMTTYNQNNAYSRHLKPSGKSTRHSDIKINSPLAKTWTR